MTHVLGPSLIRFTGHYLGRTGKSITGAHENENQWFHRTFMFRDPSLWNMLKGNPKQPGYVEKRFNGLPSKVILGACSTGHEPITAVMSFLYRFGIDKLAHTRFEAFDISAGVVQLAKTGLFWIGKRDRDLKKAQQVVSVDFLKQHLSLNQSITPKLQQQRFSHFKALMAQYKLVSEPGKPVDDPSVLHQASATVMSFLSFKTHSLDQLSIKPTDEPVLLFFRGALGMFKRDAKVRMLQNLYKKLPVGSTVVVDGYDLVRGADQALVDAQFQPLVPLGDPRRSQKMRIGRVDRYPEILIFEKNQ